MQDEYRENVQDVLITVNALSKSYMITSCIIDKLINAPHYELTLHLYSKSSEVTKKSKFLIKCNNKFHVLVKEILKIMKKENGSTTLSH